MNNNPAFTNARAVNPPFTNSTTPAFLRNLLHLRFRQLGPRIGRFAFAFWVDCSVCFAFYENDIQPSISIRSSTRFHKSSSSLASSATLVVLRRDKVSCRARRDVIATTKQAGHRAQSLAFHPGRQPHALSLAAVANWPCCSGLAGPSRGATTRISCRRAKTQLTICHAPSGPARISRRLCIGHAAFAVQRSLVYRDAGGTGSVAGHRISGGEWMTTMVTWR